MSRKVELAEIDVSSLSSEVLDLISELAASILKHSGIGFRYTDPKLLQRISYRYKKLNHPEVNDLYRKYKQALKACVNDDTGMKVAAA